MESGQLRLRGADPFSLESPTRITGTNSDGQLSDVGFVTPNVTTVRPVPDFGTTATITAAFSVLAPGTGSINEDGSMTVQLRLAVDLHIVVPLLPVPSDCRAAPINLTLTSSSPYDGERVNLQAPNFSVPPVAASDTCPGVLTTPVNDALAGSGHSLSMTLAGEITPPVAGEPTATTLAVSPEGTSSFGEDVSLTATVVPNPAVEGAPPISGVVTFFDGQTQVGTAEVGDGGTATLVTAGLTAGPRQLRAVYGGAPPDWDPSDSAVLPYTVTAHPAVVTTAAGEVRVGGSKDFDVTVLNTGFGADLAGARLEVSIGRQVGTGAIGPNAGSPRISLSQVGETGTAPIALTASGAGASQRLRGTVGDADTWIVEPGDDHTETLRIEVASGTLVGPLNITFTLVTGEGAEQQVLASAVGSITMVNEVRQATTVTAGSPARPPFLAAIPAITPVARQGNVVEIRSLAVGPAVSGVPSTGTLTFAVDGVPVLGQHNDSTLPNPRAWLSVVPKGGINFLVKLPESTPIGARQVTVRYSGDALYAPSQANFPITVEPSIGTVYECAGVGPATGAVRFTANVEVHGSLPTVWAAGQDLPLDRFEVRLRLSRTSTQSGVLGGTVAAPADKRDLRLEFDPGGTIVPPTVTSTNNAPYGVDDVNPPDHLIDLNGGTGTIAVDPAPGTTTPYTLGEIVITSIGALGVSVGFVCTPGNAAHAFGSITSAGTTLAVEPGDVVAEGRDVALTATTSPVASGVVEFRDGTTTIGVVPVDASGVARMTTDSLAVGTRSLTARFFGGVVATPSSDPVELRVASCGAASEPGAGAVVRLVFLELLGRCPDAAGYRYWTDRLDAGASPEAFARSIARTPEAVGRIVDDAYQTMLGRPADAAGRTFWTQRLQASGRYDQLLADLAASGEFWSKAGSSNGGAVTRIYERLLERSPDQSGFDYWVGRLGDGVSRRALVVTLANQSEPLGVLVDDAYDEILDRKPTGTERSEGIAFLRSTGDRSGLYARLIGTQEFHDRAQGLPDPV